ncbi:nuclear transport factor 2 family protein [Shewanella subflava]|uniref:Nuclear transport factor 2 family protein n=1 Tax=Shewanella subflava TaxID=2986476 RepID=A0ABT3IB35_9GAMM|nr:nuclear transport factor 2 family protein [Shewanella subflava]MCW3173261.1 nuclear transport factor 2 family protein [Shewanella subflava]
MPSDYSAQELATISLIDKQLEAYNARDIEAFVATYHDDIEVYTLTGGLQYQGKPTLKAKYGAKFAGLKYLHATSLTRIVQGQYLVDHELAESASEDENTIDRSVKVIAAYEVEQGLIRRVTFMG